MLNKWVSTSQPCTFTASMTGSSTEQSSRNWQKSVTEEFRNVFAMSSTTSSSSQYSLENFSSLSLVGFRAEHPWRMCTRGGDEADPQLVVWPVAAQCFGPKCSADCVLRKNVPADGANLNKLSELYSTDTHTEQNKSWPILSLYSFLYGTLNLNVKIC